MKGVPMWIFIVLRSKVNTCHAPSKDNQVYDKQACKGVHRFEIKKTKLENYMRCLFGETESDAVQKYEVTSIGSSKHIVTTSTSSKIKLSPFEDKRNYLSRCHSVAHGHWRLRWLSPPRHQHFYFLFFPWIKSSASDPRDPRSSDPNSWSIAPKYMSPHSWCQYFHRHYELSVRQHEVHEWKSVTDADCVATRLLCHVCGDMMYTDEIPWQLPTV